MSDNSVIAAVDLGSNSFRLQVARVVEGSLFPLDSLKETVRLGAGLDASGCLSQEAIDELITALSRFGERLAGLPPQCVRAVATNTFRIARNSAQFLPAAEAALGFPIEIIAGREEARLIYIGAAHSLPSTRERRLVVDIGGGSTELIIGSQYRSFRTESIQLGCVGWSMRYFPDGIITRERLETAELAARGAFLPLVPDFHTSEWQRAIGTSGTARSLADILELNDLSPLGITRGGMAALREIMLQAGHIDKISLNGLRDDRRPVLAGGFAIMQAAFDMLGIERMNITYGALRDGVLYDLMQRQTQYDVRDRTVDFFQRRYHVDGLQANRVMAMTEQLFESLRGEAAPEDAVLVRHLNMAASLHEVGRSIAHSSYHKHSAYILQHADMPGFSRREQVWLSRLVLAHAGSLTKLDADVINDAEWDAILALRLAVLFYRARLDETPPWCDLVHHHEGYLLTIDEQWLASHPLTAFALNEEITAWQNVGVTLAVQTIPAA
ncbi:exopolyphosphatase [Chitinibacter bivalviorum]|uniref:Exopolyphosphatase n=1 Tax=Chitinibacter bivalviorum TaxID=2739434 RepID=A0A7H9BJA5_9NEIS|nr:exopolyphosphatase [Chitinibacter bivalviorum]QLG88730.1 exopolyphosphatase [Chitinibacter bivalviorum]